MKLVKQTEVMMPEWAIPYLANGDATSLTEEDIAILDVWFAHMQRAGFFNPTFGFDWESEKNGFYSCPEFGLGTGCVYTHVYQFVP